MEKRAFIEMQTSNDFVRISDIVQVGLRKRNDVYKIEILTTYNYPNAIVYETFDNRDEAIGVIHTLLRIIKL